MTTCPLRASQAGLSNNPPPIMLSKDIEVSRSLRKTKCQRRPKFARGSQKFTSLSYQISLMVRDQDCLRLDSNVRSILLFSGKLISTVQCLTCHRVSTTTETFQDLSLPIPTLDSIQSATARNQRLASAASMTTTSSLSSSLNPGSMTSLNLAEAGSNPGWLGWMWGWVSSWFYGPNIPLHDCLAYFFSADELKGENMYSCEKCKQYLSRQCYRALT